MNPRRKAELRRRKRTPASFYDLLLKLNGKPFACEQTRVEKVIFLRKFVRDLLKNK